MSENKPKSGGRPGDLIALGIGAAVIFWFTRAPEGVSLASAAPVIVLVLLGALVYFGAIHYLLKLWDRWRAS